MHTEEAAALPPPVDHRSYVGVRESRGLPVSCVHDGSPLFGEDALTEALLQKICGHYAAAFKLLPITEHPEFITCFDSGGAACLGLLEPRANIVANAVINRRSYRKHHRHRRHNVDEDTSALDDATRWVDPARSCMHALVFYLQHYFRYLSWTQALGYLYLADADLVVAMGLVEMDLAAAAAAGGRFSHFTFHAPCSWRSGKALHAAEVMTCHPAVSSSLVYQRFDAAMAGRFQPVLGKHPIDAASLPDAACFLAGDGDAKRSISVYGLRRRKYGADRIVLPPPLTGVRMPRPPEGEEEAPCAFEETLRKILLDAIHICYLQAFARLADRDAAAAMHIPIVRSGLCFGPLDDPVDNILVNAVWFKTAFPSQSQAGDQQLAYNERIALLSTRSLDAAVAYLCTRFANVSRHDAILLLYRAGGCNVARAAELAELAGHAPCGERAAAVRAAVRAAGHPEEARMANFVHVLSDKAKERVLARLRRPRSGTLLGIGDLDDIALAFALDFYFPLDDGLLPEEKTADLVLSARARSDLENRTAYYERRQRRRIVRKLDAMLDENTEVLCVFGATWFCAENEAFYHVNFLARNVNEAHWDLFFAQIWDTRTRYEDEGRGKSAFSPLRWSAKLGTCMSRIEAPDLLALAMCAGRCIYCEWSTATKVFHPNYWVRYKGNDAAIEHQECGKEDDYFESDCVYFNDQKDIRLVERLNKLYS